MGNNPTIEVNYVSARNGSNQTRTGTLKEVGDDDGEYLLIDTGTVNQSKFDTGQDTKVVLSVGEVKTVTAHKTEYLGKVTNVNIQYDD